MCLTENCQLSDHCHFLSQSCFCGLVSKLRRKWSQIQQPTSVYYNVVTLFMLNILRWNDVQEWESYLKGAIDQSEILDMRVKKRETNIGQSDVNLSSLAPSCSRVPLVQGGVICEYIMTLIPECLFSTIVRDLRFCTRTLIRQGISNVQPKVLRNN